jgi:CheY-like chemotaxis protein
MTGRVLVVDDEPAAVKEMADYLAHEGLYVYGTPDPLDALNIIEGDEALHAVVTDIRMPRVDGFRILQAANEQRTIGRVKTIVAITGHATDTDERRAMECGAMYFLKKPVDLGQLLRILKPANPPLTIP